jgi:hypothetical protein
MNLLSILTSLTILRTVLTAPFEHNSSTQNSQILRRSRRDLPRFILYQQTHHDNENRPVSLLPLVKIPQLTHLYIAAFHIDGPGIISLNDHSPDHERYDTLWREVQVLKENGIKVMAMLGGAAVGSFQKLSTKNTLEVGQFFYFYQQKTDIYFISLKSTTSHL